MNCLLIADKMAMIPNPEPPEVTMSPDVFLSRARPLVGCAKSQKYLNVCCCTSVSNASLVIFGNLSVESIPVLIVTLTGSESGLSVSDNNPSLNETLYCVNPFNAAAGVITTVVLSSSRVVLNGTAVVLPSVNFTPFTIDDSFILSEKVKVICG